MVEGVAYLCLFQNLQYSGLYRYGQEVCLCIPFCHEAWEWGVQSNVGNKIRLFSKGKKENLFLKQII